MILTKDIVDLTFERNFRQKWMNREEWGSFRRFLIDKGFNYQAIKEQIAEEWDGNIALLENIINTYVESLHPIHKEREVI